MPALARRGVGKLDGFLLEHLFNLGSGKGFSMTPNGPSQVSPLGARPLTFNRPSVIAA
jgi:hypothetical protein